MRTLVEDAGRGRGAPAERRRRTHCPGERTPGPGPQPAAAVAVRRRGPARSRARRRRSPCSRSRVGLVVPGPSAAQDRPPGPDLVPVAQAYTAAWNAHDLDAVLAGFAPDAVVRERRGDVPPAVWDTRDPQVVRAYLDGLHDGAAYDPSGLVWVTGHRQIAALGRRALRAAPPLRGWARTAPPGTRWAGRTGSSSTPTSSLPGVGPAEGEAEAVVRGGRIAVLSFVQSPASVQRQRRRGRRPFVRAMATDRAVALGSGSGGPRARRRTGTRDLAGGAGLALLAGVAARRCAAGEAEARAGAARRGRGSRLPRRQSVATPRAEILNHALLSTGNRSGTAPTGRMTPRGRVRGGESPGSARHSP